MRAKRSKKYRRTMSAYGLAFSFREPYQVLVDSHFLRTCHAFHMPLQKYLDNTLHGPCKIFVTQCTLSKIMAQHAKDIKDGKVEGRFRKRPQFLPPPTELPLRYCKHKNDEGEELGVVSEERCLLDLLAGQPHGNEVAKNKQHYILATAEAEDAEKRRKGFVDVRERARLIPGVPVVYVKRSVMILEELSAASERVRRTGEKEKFRDGLVGIAADSGRKRKRGEVDSDAEDELDGAGWKQLLRDVESSNSTAQNQSHMRAKGPNPLSVRKKKAKPAADNGVNGDNKNDADPDSKSKRRRKHGSKKTAAEDIQESAAASVGIAVDEAPS